MFVVFACFFFPFPSRSGLVYLYTAHFFLQFGLHANYRDSVTLYHIRDSPTLLILAADGP